ncbi:unnamed protein product [Rotaria magnacalcarata]|uniref:Uncharacterized protein n=1 Tax=Rotaria magnacalcarata TaxID=392030 RepID=A0A8S3JJQ6_9BILA|nr:unnamed protein product [Rotaria magnacalcarata]
MFRRGTKRPRFSVGGHAVFEHDDSSSHSGFGMMEYEEDSSSQQLTTSNSDSNILLNQNSLERPKRVQKMLTKFHTEDNTHLNACLDHLLLTLSRKDKEGFFQYPVTDQVKLFETLKNTNYLSQNMNFLYSLHQATRR